MQVLMVVEWGAKRQGARAWAKKDDEKNITETEGACELPCGQSVVGWSLVQLR